MSLSKVHTLLDLAVKNIDIYSEMKVGRESDINLYSERDSPLYWLIVPYTISLPTIVNQNRYNETHNVRIYIVKQDKESADNLETFQILTECDDLAQQLVQYLYEVAINDNQMDIQNTSFSQVIKFKAGSVYSGVVINMQLVFPNDVSIC